jgi:hypothetical protein
MIVIVFHQPTSWAPHLAPGCHVRRSVGCDIAWPLRSLGGPQPCQESSMVYFGQIKAALANPAAAIAVRPAKQPLPGHGHHNPPLHHSSHPPIHQSTHPPIRLGSRRFHALAQPCGGSGVPPQSPLFQRFSKHFKAENHPPCSPNPPTHCPRIL